MCRCTIPRRMASTFTRSPARRAVVMASILQEYLGAIAAEMEAITTARRAGDLVKVEAILCGIVQRHMEICRRGGEASAKAREEAFCRAYLGATAAEMEAITTARRAGDLVKVEAILRGIVQRHMEICRRGVSMKAGHQTAAESWGTGRAVSRIPRVPGGGTHRAGQGAFGNMCRGGHMFAPTKTWRRWHRKINISQKRYAVASALAASGLPALVMARGHRIEQVPEVPLVVSDAAESITKTSKALELLKSLGATADVEKSKDSKALRRGKGKMRNRRYVLRKGPLVVYGADHGIGKAFRNLPGVEVASVDSLNLLQLAPGGHLGRFIIFTKSAFDRLDKIFGTQTTESETKKGFKLPRSCMTNADVARLINSDEVQSVVNAPKEGTAKHYALKKNPLKNLGAMVKLNPQAASARRNAILLSERQAKERAARLAKLREGKPTGAPKRSEEQKKLAKDFYKQMIVDSEYQGEDYEVFDRWLGVAQ